MQVIDAFKQVITNEISIIEQLINCGQNKQKAMNDAELLSTIVDQERVLLMDLEKVEQERQGLLDVMAPGQTLSAWLDGENQPELAATVDDLKTKYGQLQELNLVNQRLIQESLAFVQYSLNLLVDDNPTTYNKPGTKTTSKSIIDRKV